MKMHIQLHIHPLVHVRPATLMGLLLGLGWFGVGVSAKSEGLMNGLTNRQAAFDLPFRFSDFE